MGPDTMTLGEVVQRRDFAKFSARRTPHMSLEIEIVPCLSDNYAYLVKSGDHCAVVDPSEAGPVKAALDRLRWGPAFILNPHPHIDHVGGNLELKALYGAEIVGPGKDAGRIPGIDTGVDEHSGWEF